MLNLILAWLILTALIVSGYVAWLWEDDEIELDEMMTLILIWPLLTMAVSLVALSDFMRKLAGRRA